MTVGDPLKESANITRYPGTLIADGVVDDEVECQYPGCTFKASDYEAAVNHVKSAHKLVDIECSRCKKKTRLEGKRWCVDCVQICEPAQATEEELKHSRELSAAAETRNEEAKRN